MKSFTRTLCKQQQKQAVCPMMLTSAHLDLGSRRKENARTLFFVDFAGK